MVPQRTRLSNADQCHSSGLYERSRDRSLTVDFFPLYSRHHPKRVYGGSFMIHVRHAAPELRARPRRAVLGVAPEWITADWIALSAPQSGEARSPCNRMCRQAD